MPEDVIDPRKNQRRSCRQKTRVSKFVGDKKWAKHTFARFRWKDPWKCLLAVGESAGGGMSPEIGPLAHKCWCVENSAGEENDAWRRVTDWLMPEFLLVGRSGPDAPDG